MGRLSSRRRRPRRLLPSKFPIINAVDTQGRNPNQSGILPVGERGCMYMYTLSHISLALANTNMHTCIKHPSISNHPMHPTLFVRLSLSPYTLFSIVYTYTTCTLFFTHGNPLYTLYHTLFFLLPFRMIPCIFFLPWEFSFSHFSQFS